MRKLLLLLLLFLISITMPLFPGKVAVLNQLKKPSGFYINSDHLYIIEFPLIYVHSLKDYRLIKKFGNQGEGPGEFIRYARLHFHPDYYIIQSQTRFSYFTKDWKYIKDMKTPITFDRGAKQMGDQWVVSHTVPGKDDAKQTDLTVNIYDADFKKIKEVYRQKYYFQVGKPINGIYLAEMGRRMGIRFSVCDNKIFIEGEDGENGNIYVYDSNGQQIDTLHHEFEKLKVTKEHKKAVEDYYVLRRRRLFAIVKARGWLYWPDFFPAVHYQSVVDNKIHVIPYKKKKGKNQLFIFNLKGELLKQVDFPVKEETMFSFYPNTIKNGKLYQLLENENEEWELHVTDIH
jgi:hypothetical protein